MRDFAGFPGQEKPIIGQRAIAGQSPPPPRNFPFMGSGLIDLTLANSIHPGTTETDMGDQVLTMRPRNLGTNDLEPARQ
jgi:hypothetical protein